MSLNRPSSPNSNQYLWLATQTAPACQPNLHPKIEIRSCSQKTPQFTARSFLERQKVLQPSPRSKFTTIIFGRKTADAWGMLWMPNTYPSWCERVALNLSQPNGRRSIGMRPHTKIQCAMRARFREPPLFMRKSAEQLFGSPPENTLLS